MYKTNILTVSIIAMMAVNAARADIASTNYVTSQIQPVTQALSGKQDTSNMITTTTGDSYTSNKTSTTKYPSMATAAQLAADVQSNLGTQIADKQSILVSNDNVIVSGSGNVVTAVNAPGDGSITFTKGTTLGSLATKSEVAKSDLASGVQTSLNAADAALPAATYNNQVGTVSAANMGTTAGTVVGAIKEINDKAYDATDDDSLISQITAAKGDISQLQSDVSTLENDSQVKSSADYQVGKAGGGWTTLDAGQIAAINSGATSALVGKISTNEAAINTLNGSGAGSVANSIATALTSYSTTAQMNTELAKKQNVLTAGDRITITTDTQTGDLVISAADQSYSDTALANRVTAIENSAAYNSGITSGKVDTYDAYATNKQDKIDSDHKLATNLIATSSDAQFVTAAEKTAWSGKQAALDSDQLAAVNSGITAAKVSTYDGYATSKQDKIDSTHKLSTDLIANDAGFITKDVNNLTNYTTTANMNTALAGKQPVSAGVSVGGTGGTWNSLTNGSGITITTSDGTTTIATAKEYVPMPSANGTTGKSVLTYDSTANSGAGAYYWEEIGR